MSKPELDDPTWLKGARLLGYFIEDHPGLVTLALALAFVLGVLLVTRGRSC